MFDAGSVVARVKADISDFKDGMNQAQQHTSKFKEGFSQVTAVGATVLRGLAVAGTAAAAFGVLSVKAFTESEDAQTQLKSVLQSTGQAAGVTAEQANKLAESFQRTTKFSDETILNGESLLLTFTNIGKDVFPAATQTMLDMSQALGQDTKSSAIQLGKALNDPIQGVTALRRVGVSFTEAQLEQIKVMQESGDLMGAQKLILGELSKEFGGSAEAAGTTFSGKLTILKNTLGDLMEGVGKFITDAIAPLLDGFQQWLDKAGGVEGVVATLKDKIEELKPVIPALVGIIVALLIPAFIALGVSIWGALSPLLPFIAAGAIIGTIVGFLVEKMGGWNVVMGFLKEAWANFMQILQPAIEFFNTHVKPILDILIATMGDLINNGINQIAAAFQQLQPWIQAHKEELKMLAIIIGVVLLAPVIAIGVAFIAAGLIIAAAISVIGTVINWLVGVSKGAWDTIKAGLAAVGAFFRDTGNNINNTINNIAGWINGLINNFNKIKGGIQSALAGVGDAIMAPFKGAFDWVNGKVDAMNNKMKDLNPFQRHSPSLYDLISKGTEAIRGEYANMFGSIGDMAGRFSAVNLAPALVNPGGAGVIDNRINTSINGPINIGSEVDANNFMARLTHNQELVQRGLTPKT